MRDFEGKGRKVNQLATANLHTTDEALIQRYRDTESEEAAHELVSRHWARAYQFCYRSLREPNLAEDAAQEAFIRLLASARSFRGDCTMRSWLYRILLNVVRSYARTRSRQIARSSSLAAASQRAAEVKMDPTEEIPVQEVLEHLQQLPAKLQSVLSLKYLEGYNEREIAGIVQIPLGTVASRVRRGLDRLRESLGVVGRAAPLSGILLAFRQADAEAAQPPPAPPVEILRTGAIELARKALLLKSLCAVLALALLVPAAWMARNVLPGIGSDTTSGEAHVALARGGAEILESSPPLEPFATNAAVERAGRNLGAHSESSAIASGVPSTAGALSDEPARTSGIRISGRLHWLDPDRPVAGEEITLFRKQTESPEEREDFSTETAADGTFAFEVSGPGSFGLHLDKLYSFEAKLNGKPCKVNGWFLNFEVPEATSKAELDLFFTASLSARGRIMEAGTLLPVEGAIVASWGGQKTGTDASGSFRLEPFPGAVPTSREFQVSHPGYAAASAEISWDSEEQVPFVEIYVEKGIEVSGRVTDPAGILLAGVEVRYEGSVPYQKFPTSARHDGPDSLVEREPADAHTSWYEKTSTNEEGFFRLRQLPSRSISKDGASGSASQGKLKASCVGYLPAEVRLDRISATTENFFEILLHRAIHAERSLHIRVMDSEKDPIERAYIVRLAPDEPHIGRFWPMKEEGNTTLRDDVLAGYRRTGTSSKGEAILEGVGQKEERLFIGAPGYETRIVNLGPEFSGEELVVILAAESSISGKVTDEQGNPLRNVMVEAFSESAVLEALQAKEPATMQQETIRSALRTLRFPDTRKNVPTSLAGVLTDANGQFVLSGLARGAYALVAEPPMAEGEPVAVFPVVAPGDLVSIKIPQSRRPVLRLAPRIRGSNHPLRKLLCQVTPFGQERDQSARTFEASVEDSGATIALWEPGTYRIVIQAAGSLPLDLGTHFFSSGSTADFGDVWLPAGGGTLQGKLKIPDGWKQWNINITTADRATGLERTVRLEPGVTDFQMSSLAPGVQTLTVDLHSVRTHEGTMEILEPGFGPFTFDVSIAEGQTTEVEWILPP